MKKIFIMTLLTVVSYPVFSQLDNVALIFHTNNHPDFAFLDRQSDMIKDDLLFTYGFRTSPYKNFSKLNFINSVATECSADTSQLIVYIAGITLKDEEGKAYIMLAGSDSTDFGNMLPYDDLFSAFEDCEVQNLLVIMDVVNAAEQMKSRASELTLREPYEPDSTVTREDFIKKKMGFKSRVFIANSATELILTGRYSTFSSKMMEALRNYGGVDGVLTLTEIKSYTDVMINVPLMGAFKGHEDGGDFWMISR